MTSLRDGDGAASDGLGGTGGNDGTGDEADGGALDGADSDGGGSKLDVGNMLDLPTSGAGDDCTTLADIIASTRESIPPAG